MPCPTCVVLDCSNPSDVEQYSLQSGLIFTNPTLGFVVPCPVGYVCATGYYPIVITIPVGTIKLPVPPTQFPTLQDIVLSLNCCESTVSRTVIAGSTQAQLGAIALQLITECAAQQARCDVITEPPAPGVPPPMPVNPPDNPATNNTRVDVRSAAQTASKACGAGMSGSISLTSPVGLFGAVLWNPSPAYIAATQAQVDAYALAATQAQVDAIDPPEITNAASLPAATIGVPYSEQLNGNDGTPPYTFALVSGNLPAGITLSTTGLISGTPTEDGTFTFTVLITDAAGHSCSKEFTIGAAVVCPEFKENITDGTMDLSATAVAADDLSKVLVLGRLGNIQIIESVGNVDSVTATGSVPASLSVQYGIYVPTIGKFFVNSAFAGDNPIRRISPVDASIEATGLAGVASGARMDYNSVTDRIITFGDSGGGWGILSINPATVAGATLYIATNLGANAAIYCPTGNRVFVGKEPTNSECRFLNGSSYATVADFDLFLEHGGLVTNVTQFLDAGVECLGKFFYGCAFVTGVPRTSVELAVMDPAALTFIGFIDLTSETLDDIEWIEADEDFGIILVKANTKMIVVDADTHDIICSFNTSSTCFQFAVQMANNRVFVPNQGVPNVAVYTHTP